MAIEVHMELLAPHTAGPLIADTYPKADHKPPVRQMARDGPHLFVSSVH